jgi:hypothetical protein
MPLAPGRAPYPPAIGSISTLRNGTGTAPALVEVGDDGGVPRADLRTNLAQLG